MGDDITIGVTEIVNNIEVTAQPNDQIVDISVIDNADDVTLNITPTVIEINVNKGSSYARWGTIYGNLTDQTDLTNALILKADLVDGKVPAYQLPSFVDDVVEVANYAALPAMGEIGKIYVTLDNNKIYRWSGSIYIEIAANNAIWGAITGTLSNQTDLQNALDLKQNSLSWMSPLRVAGGTVSISYSGVSTNGALSSTDWNTFNGKANDNAVVHLTGDETITGQKVFNNSSNSISIYSNNTSVGTGIYSDNSAIGTGIQSINSSSGLGFYSQNTSTGKGIQSNNTSTGRGIYSQNSSTGQGFYSDNSGLGTGIYSTNTAAGKGIQCYNSSTGTGFYSNNSAGGIALYSNNESSGRNLLLNNTTTATGMPFTIQKQGVDKFTINDAGGVYAAGSVGIGITSPSVKLVVDGGSGDYTPIWAKSSFLASSKYYASLYTGYALTSNQSSQFGYVYDTVTPTNSFAHITPYGSAEGSKFTVRADGNVGIGTISPTSKLHVDGNIYSSGYFNSNNIYLGKGSDLFTGGSANDGGLMVSGSNNLIFGNALTERMRITSGGNVGINTTSPTIGKLQINAVAGTETFLALNSSNTGAGCGNILFNENGTSRWNIGTTSDNSLQFYNQGVNAALYIRKSDSNVGIGTTSPYCKLAVGSTTSANGEIGFIPDFEGSSEHALISRSSSGFKPLNIEGETLKFWSGSTSTTERMRITSGGNVGIGTSSPINAGGAARWLTIDGTTTYGGGFISSINGTAKAYFYSEAGYAKVQGGSGEGIQLQPNAGSNGLTIYSNTNYQFYGSNVSDKRAKTKIKDLEINALEKVMALKSKSYYMKNAPDKIRYGFIAQDVNEILPDLINGDLDSEDYIGLDYNGIIPILTKAIQELKAEIEILKNK